MRGDYLPFIYALERTGERRGTPTPDFPFRNGEGTTTIPLIDPDAVVHGTFDPRWSLAGDYRPVDVLQSPSCSIDWQIPSSRTYGSGGLP